MLWCACITLPINLHYTRIRVRSLCFSLSPSGITLSKEQLAGATSYRLALFCLCSLPHVEAPVRRCDRLPPHFSPSGITLSKEQLAEATQRVKAEGLSDRVHLMYCDYRDCPGGLWDTGSWGEKCGEESVAEGLSDRVHLMYCDCRDCPGGFMQGSVGNNVGKEPVRTGAQG